MSALLYHIADGWQPGTVDDRNIFDLVEPAHIQNSSLTAHVEGLQAVEIGLIDCPAFRGVEQYRNDQGHVEA